MINSFSKKTLLFLSAFICIAGCIVDVVLVYVFGNQIPGYNQLTNTMSSLGESLSPVSGAVTLWSSILGFIFIFFGIGFRAVFKAYGKATLTASLLIIFYGIGEGIASGVFKADHINGALTAAAIVHDLLGGIGVIAAMILPLVMMKIFNRKSSPLFFRFSAIIWSIGLIAMLLFSLRFATFEDSPIKIYKGLWQRIFLVDYYIYFAWIAIMMIKHINRESNRPIPFNNGTSSN